MTETDNTIVVLGAGIAGCYEAICLAKRGFKVHLYEKRRDILKYGAGEGRSINLALSARGIKSLKHVGLDEVILSEAIPMYGRLLHLMDGTTSYVPYGIGEECIRSISRNRLNEILLQEASNFPNVKVFFNHSCQNIDIRGENVRCKFQKIDENDKSKNELVEETYRRVIGADGVYSRLCQTMLRTKFFDYSQEYLDHCYKEITLLPQTDENNQPKYAFENHNALHIWPRDKFMLIALPNIDKSFTCTLFMPEEGETSFQSLKTFSQVEEFFKKNFPDVFPMLSVLEKDWFDNPTSTLLTLRCFPYHYEDKSLLIGDSAHAVVPFFGQGMNAALEDCLYFEEILDKHTLPAEGDSNDKTNVDWKNALSEYSRVRKPDADSIARLSMDNYIEMRSKTKSLGFLIKKKIETTLHRIFPKSFIPLYSMVSFNTIPYSKVIEKVEYQDKILKRSLFLMSGGLILLFNWKIIWQKLSYFK